MDPFVIIWALVTVLLVVTAIYPSWYWDLVAWQFRTPEKMRPSPRRWRILRAHMSVLAAGSTAALVFTLWPGTEVAKITAGVVTLLAAYALLGILALVTVFSRRHEQRLLHEGANPPPNEPSEEGYGLLYVSVGITAGALAIAAFMIAGMFYDESEHEADAATTTPEEQEAIDGVLDDFRDYRVFAPVEVLAAAPEGAVIANPTSHVAVLPDAREPRELWEFSSAGATSVEAALDAADLAVAVPRWRCTVTQVVVVETETTVTVGLVVTLPATPTEPAPTGIDDRVGVPECEAVIDQTVTQTRNWFPIDLDRPLGDRDVVTLAGGRVHEEG